MHDPTWPLPQHKIVSKLHPTLENQTVHTMHHYLGLSSRWQFGARIPVSESNIILVFLLAFVVPCIKVSHFWTESIFNFW
jgi:hypothetical protein